MDARIQTNSGKVHLRLTGRLLDRFQVPTYVGSNTNCGVINEH